MIKLGMNITVMGYESVSFGLSLIFLDELGTINKVRSKNKKFKIKVASRML